MQQFRLNMGGLESQEAESDIESVLNHAKPVCDKCFQTNAEHQLLKMAQKGGNKTPGKAKIATSTLKALNEEQTIMIHPALLEFGRKMKA